MKKSILIIGTIIISIFVISLTACPEPPPSPSYDFGELYITIWDSYSVNVAVDISEVGITLYAYAGVYYVNSYQWKKDGVNVGTNSNTYIPEEEGSYTVTISAPWYNSKTSSAINVYLPESEHFSELPGDIYISLSYYSQSGSAASNSLVNQSLYAHYSFSYENVSYQWKKDNVNIVGETSSWYTPTEPGSYTVTISRAGYRSKTSEAVIVDLPEISGSMTVSPNHAEINSILNVNINDIINRNPFNSSAVSYQWQRDNINVGTNSGTYKVTEAGSYTVTISVEGYKSKTSAAVIATGSDEGIYVGIISFAGDTIDLTDNEPILLNTTGRLRLLNILDNHYRKSSQVGTALFYGVHNALANLKNTESNYPYNLDSVNIITFTDGLDNGSTGRAAFSPIEDQEFASASEYAQYVNDQIGTRTVGGLPVTAYSVGVMGSDVTDVITFQNNLDSIASTGKSNYLSDFSQIQSTFNEIVEGLNTAHTTTDFVMITPMLDSGTKVRMTFDIDSTDPLDAASSTKYIEGTVNRSGQAYTLNSITFAGVSLNNIGAGSITGTVNGSEVSFVLPDITDYDHSDTINSKQWLMSSGSSAWQINSEYSSTGSSSSTVERRSAVIYLVLDSSTSLSDSEVNQIRSAAKGFINTLAAQSAIAGSEMLQTGVWRDSAINFSGETVYHSFNVVQGITYYIWCNKQSYGTGKTVNPTVSAYYSNGDNIGNIPSNSGAYSYPGITFTANRTGQVILEVNAGNSTGTYAIGFSLSSSTRPTN